MSCVLCDTDGGELVWRGDKLRVIRADEAGFPAFYRVVWNAHVAEFSDLSALERAHCMEVVVQVEQALRAHLHWHVIARFDWDSHFPAPVWAAAVRERALEKEDAVRALLPAVEGRLVAALNALDYS